MAQITGFGPACLQRCQDRGPVDLMRTHPPEQAVGGIGHMAVITQRACGIRRMMGVLSQVFFVLLVAAQTGLISIHSLFELLVGVTFVHGMAAYAGKFTLLIAGALD